MPRRPHSQQVGFQRILTRVQGVIDSPLRSIGLELLTVITELQQAIDGGYGTFDVPVLTSVFDNILDLLPTRFGDRFFFDAAMVFESIDPMTNQQVTFNPMIVPLHGNKWGHQSLPMPSSSKSHVNMVDFVLFPDRDDLSQINLLSYPFMLHELGHNLFFRYDEDFREGFKRALDRIANKLSLFSIADRGAARLQSQQSIEMIRRFWTPTSDHSNWAHELAIDVVALWLSGPAYLAAFLDETDGPKIDPFLVKQNHPPYEVRVRVLLKVAGQLGWGKYCNALEQLHIDWRNSRRSSNTSDLNRYVALANQEIVDSCAALALRTCETLRLPKCNEQKLTTIREAIERGDTPDLGLDLIIAAWLVHHVSGELTYQGWQSRVIEDLQQYITR